MGFKIENYKVLTSNEVMIHLRFQRKTHNVDNLQTWKIIKMTLIIVIMK